MRVFVAAGLLSSLVACSDVMEENHATWAEAREAGAIRRGWIPAFVPSSARDIHDVHDLDSNAQTLTFSTPPSDVPQMLAGLRPIAGEDTQAARDLAREVEWPGRQAHTRALAYLVCSHPRSGALLVDAQSGRAAYKAPVEWAKDDCSSAYVAQDRRSGDGA